MLKPRAKGHDILAKNSQHCWELFRPFARNLKFEQFQTLRSNSQQHATTCNRVCKKTKHVTSDKTLLPVFQMLLASDWVLDDSRLLVFFLSLPSVCISDETLPLVFNILLPTYHFPVFVYQTKHSLSCLIFYFSVFGCQIKHSFSRLIFYLSVLKCEIKNSFSCLKYHSRKKKLKTI